MPVPGVPRSTAGSARTRLTAVRRDNPRVAAVRRDKSGVAAPAPPAARLRLIRIGREGLPLTEIGREGLLLTEIGREGLRSWRRTGGRGPGRLPLAQVLEPRVIGVIAEAACVRIVPARRPGGLLCGLPAIVGRVRLVQVLLVPRSPLRRRGGPLIRRPLRPRLRVTLLVSVLPAAAGPRLALAGIGPGFVMRSTG